MTWYAGSAEVSRRCQSSEQARRRGLHGGAAIGLMFWLIFAGAVAHALEPGQIHYSDGHLSVNLDRAPLAQVLGAIARHTGMQFRIDASVEGELSIRFSDLPLEQALKRLLAGYSHVLVLGQSADRPVRRVMVLAAGEDDGLLPEAHIANAQDTVVAAVAPTGARELVLVRQPSGHYLADGYLNGVAARFLIDTGATTVAIPARLASQARLRQGQEQMAETAAGKTVTYQTSVGSLSVGPLGAVDVPAHVVPDLSDQYVLLGMSFLSRYSLVQEQDRLVIREP